MLRDEKNNDDEVLCCGLLWGGGSMVAWLGRQNWNPEVEGLSPVLTTILCCSL